MDPDSHHVTHVPRNGLLRGRKEVAIPISAVTGVDDGIRLNLSHGRRPAAGGHPPPERIDASSTRMRAAGTRAGRCSTCRAK